MTRQLKVNLDVPCKPWAGHYNSVSGHGSNAQVEQMRASYTGVRGQRAALAREYGVTKARVTQILGSGVVRP